MKKNIFAMVSSIAFFSFSFAQNFQGSAEYSSQTDMGNFDIKVDGMPESAMEAMKEKMKKMFEKEYVLTFNTFESVYQEKEKLNAPSPSQNSSFRIEAFGGGNNQSKLYKNTKEKTFLSEDEIFGKEFLVADTLQKYNWILMDEQKKIGAYTCYKAQYVEKVTQKQIDNYNEDKKLFDEGKNTFFTPEEPKDNIIVAWYAPEIPIANGPEKYWGLPGLILELHEKSTTYLCSKITLNPNEKVEIKKPKTGKKVSQAEFDKIEEDKLNEMKDDNGVIQIKMN